MPLQVGQVIGYSLTSRSSPYFVDTFLLFLKTNTLRKTSAMAKEQLEALMTANYASHKSMSKTFVPAAVYGAKCLTKPMREAKNLKKNNRKYKSLRNDLLFILGNKYHSVRFDSRRQHTWQETTNARRSYYARVSDGTLDRNAAS